MTKGKWFAAYWQWQLRSESPKVRAMRREVVGGARGRVLEIGCGPGSNFSYYGDAAETIVAIDPNIYMVERARKSAAGSGRPIEVREARAEELPFDDSSFDTAVSTFNMCSVETPARGLAEIRRVLKPGGEYRFADHVRYANRFGAFWQDAITPLWSRALNAGCHPNRDVASMILGAGFEFAQLDHPTPFWPVPPMGLLRPHILGVAHP